MRLYWLMCAIGSLVYGAESDDEALFLRRIADFWQEGEYQIAKTQMEEFIGEYPESPFSDALCAALGDLFLREKNYSNALNYYAQVQSTEFRRKVFLNRMQCLYEMQWYATLADECEAYLQSESNLHVTYFLAIALYHQCINASKETDQLLKFAERAEPHFETLYQSELSNEISQGYAHLCCVLKNYQKATEIYLDLARKDPKSEEEMLFQAALIQSEYDKQLALETFDRIAKLGCKRSKEAAYNRMVLAFELGRYEDLANENSIDQIPPDRIGAARLFLGRSLLHLKKYEDAVRELKAYISEAPVSESLYAALLSLLDASYQCEDLISLDQAIDKLAASYPENPELPKAYFSRAQILKKQERYSDAKKQLENLLSQFPAFQQKAQTAFELTHLNYKLKDWDCCYQNGLKFLHEFSQHELAPFVWRYFASSSSEIAALRPEHLPQLAADLEMFLKSALSDTEKSEWQLILAKTYLEMHRYEEAIKCLQNQENPNALLLLSICYRDGYRDIEKFCEIAEQALSKGANLVEPGQIHLSLYNGYLELSQIEKGAQHLHQAFMANAELKIDNLLWLADHYYNQFLEYEGNFVLAAHAADLLEKCKTAIQSDPCKADLQIESVLTKLAKIYSTLGRLDEAAALIEPLSSLGNEAKLILAEIYAKKGLTEKAAPLYDSIVASLGKGRSLIGAAARLQGARLKLAKETPNLVEIATQLKDLVLQKNFEGEPLYLEAALDYVSLVAKNDPSRKISLLQKTKSDFLQTEDLLSKDYHAARAQSSRKNQIFQSYMKLIDAEILAAQSEIDLQNQKELQAKSKDILLQMINEQLCSTLELRVRKILADEP